jgi:predicted nucleic acid-binding protein
MIANFAVSYYYLALVNERDAGHEKALEFSRRYRGQTVTTEWVLIEVADALSTPKLRPIFLDILGEIENNPGLTVVEASHQLFQRGVELFSRRLDKAWSLTDCISFLVMRDHGINEALTADHHFEQAGFVPVVL